MSYRELWVLIAKLPQDSWTQTALRDDPNRQELPTRDAGSEDRDERQFGPWALVNYQLAELTDAIRLQTWLTQVINTAQGKPQPQRPEPTPRPGAKPEKARALSPEQWALLLRDRPARERVYETAQEIKQRNARGGE